MTTYAYKNGVLVADTAVTMGGQYLGTTLKIVKKGPFLAAASGSASLARNFIDWVARGMKGDVPDMLVTASKEDWTAWGQIFCPDGLVVSFEPNGVNTYRSPFTADGSGGMIAMGAMAHGATAEEAVRIACKLDVATREPIVILRHYD